MEKEKINERVCVMKEQIIKGIPLFMEKHGFKTDYEAQKAAGLSPNTINNMRVNGGGGPAAFLKLGIGAGYKGSWRSILNRVYKDLEGK